jgi:hypothetical protein
MKAQRTPYFGLEEKPETNAPNELAIKEQMGWD